MTERSIGVRMAEALTKEQIVHLLDTVFHMLGKERIRELVRLLDEDAASTLSRLLGPGESPAVRIVSDDKTMEEWVQLWNEWSDIVSELGEEHGKYAEQENDWDQPYFAANYFADDLDRVAEKMLPFLKKIQEIGREDEGVFERALFDIEDGINGYPEWMGADADVCYLGELTTRCVLTWGRLEAASAADFAANTAQIEDRLKIVGLDQEAVVDYFVSLPEEDCRLIYTYINDRREEPFWHDLLGSSRSEWHRIYYGFRSSFESEGYLEDCRRLLHEDWHYGLPLVRRLVSDSKYAEAEKIIEQTIASYLKADWKPEESLFVSIAKFRYFSGSPDEKLVELLKDWLCVAGNLNKEERAASLRFQLVTLENPHSWNIVAESCRDLYRSPFSDTASRLIEQWKHFVLPARLGRNGAGAGSFGDCWVTWLIDVCLDEAANGARFISKTGEWLQSVAATPATRFGEHQYLLSILSCDLMHLYESASKYRRLRERICELGDDGRGSTASRRAWLEKVNADQFTPLVLRAWKSHAPHLVPDPARAEKSNYTRSAQWLAALNELDPAACRKIIDKWKTAHSRKTNLWKAIREHGLPC